MISRSRFDNIGQCPICRQGELGARYCAANHPPILLCNECEAIWPNSDTSAPPLYPCQPDSLCPYCEQPLFGPGTRWGTALELQQLGWMDQPKSALAKSKSKSSKRKRKK